MSRHNRAGAFRFNFVQLSSIGRVRVVLLTMLAVLILVSPGSVGFATDAGQEQTVSTQSLSPEATCPAGGQCFADVLPGDTFYEFVNRIYLQDLVTGYPCGGPGEPCDAESRPYYRPGAGVNRGQMAKFIDNARRLPEIRMDVPSGPAPIYSRNDTGSAIGAYSTSGQALTALSESNVAIYAQTSGTTSAVYGFSTGTQGAGVSGSGGTGVKGTGSGANGVGVRGDGPTGVQGESNNGVGVEGFSTSSSGVHGYSSASSGVFGNSGNNYGVAGESNAATGAGVYGVGYNGARAGLFQGNVHVTGNLSKGAGSFKIDHPLDPENKYLYHSFVESPDMMNIYNGNVVLDERGEATVEMPEWFDALNREFRYQLTTIGGFAPVYVAEEVTNNRFRIGGGTPGMKVSWQVTGIRHDPYAEQNRIPVEEAKAPEDQGRYLHPAEWGQPESQGINYENQQQLRELSERTSR